MAIALTITETGLRAVLDAQNKGLTLRLSTIKFGSGKYQAQAEMSDLKAPFAQATIASGGVETSTSILRLICNFKDSVSREIYEMGIYDEQGRLFALASSQNEPFFVSSPNFSVIVILGMRLLGVDADRVELVLDHETSKAIALIGLHISEHNPHPQYALLSKMDQLLKRVEKQIGEIFMTNMAFENGEQVARYLGYGRWKRYGNGQVPVAVQHLDDVQGFDWLKKMGALGGQWHDNQDPKMGIVTGMWIRIPTVSDFVSFVANRIQVAVGQTVEFTLTTQLAEFTKIDYEIHGVTPSQIALASLTGQMTVGQDGNAKLSLKMSDDYIAQGDQTLTVQLVDSALSASVKLIDSGETQAPTTVYKTGTHQIIIQPNQIMSFDLYAGGGGGGGSRWSTQHGDVNGQNGGDVRLSLNQSTIVVGGGTGGTGGVWGNGSSYSNGQAGIGGNNSIDNQDDLEILLNQRGNDGVSNQHRYGVQKGADVVAGAMQGANFGGQGANGVGDERWSYGGAGGSGGHVKVKFSNTGDSPITATLVVGATGLGARYGTHGGDGGFAYAVVS